MGRSILRKMVSLIFTVSIAWAMMLGTIYSQEMQKSVAKKRGVLSVKGTLLREDEAPLSDQTVFIVEIDQAGNAVGWFDEEGVMRASVAEGKTDSQGRFHIRVPRDNFRGDKLRFTLFLRGKGQLHYPDYQRGIRTSEGTSLILEMEEKSSLLDMDKEFGPVKIIK